MLPGCYCDITMDEASLELNYVEYSLFFDFCLIRLVLLLMCLCIGSHSVDLDKPLSFTLFLSWEAVLPIAANLAYAYRFEILVILAEVEIFAS